MSSSPVGIIPKNFVIFFHSLCCGKSIPLTSSDFSSLIIMSLYRTKKMLSRPFAGRIFLSILTITETNGAYEREEEYTQIE